MNPEQTEFEALLEHASPRQAPPEDVRARVLAAVEQEWLRRKRRRWAVPLALAASLLLALGFAVLSTSSAEAVDIQVTETGGVWVDGVRVQAGGVEIAVRPGASLVADADTRLVTADGTELRLRRDTRVVWAAPAAVELRRGSLYVDTGGERLDVRTPLGLVRDVGTIFMVTVGDDQVEVAMREGVTSMTTPHGVYDARAEDRRGDVLRVDAVTVETRTEALSSGRWAWTHNVHPGYAERAVTPLLRAIAGDLGLGLTFASPAVEASALSLEVQGDLSGLDPDRALQVVLATTGLARRPSGDDRLVIGFTSAPK